MGGRSSHAHSLQDSATSLSVLPAAGRLSSPALLPSAASAPQALDNSSGGPACHVVEDGPEHSSKSASDDALKPKPKSFRRPWVPPLNLSKAQALQAKYMAAADAKALIEANAAETKSVENGVAKSTEAQNPAIGQPVG